MLDAVTLIGLIFGILAVLYGLLSRNFGTAFVAGLFVGVIHAGLVALAVVQSGTGIAALPFSRTASELVMRSREVPVLKDSVDLALQSPYSAMPPAQLAAYLFAGALVLMLTLVLLYVEKWALTGLVSIVIPRKA